MLELRNISVFVNKGTAHERCILDSVSLSISQGEFVSVIGDNGAGKSTLVQVITGTMPVTSGDIIFQGRNITAIPAHKRASFIGFVGQNPRYTVCEDLTVGENLTLAAMRRRCKSWRRALPPSITLPFVHSMDTPVTYLSGGEKQLLALKMLELAQSDICILDEHTAALSPHMSRKITEITKGIGQSSPVLMITHKWEEALTLSSRIVVLREGKCLLDVPKNKTCLRDLTSLFSTD